MSGRAAGGGGGAGGGLGVIAGVTAGGNSSSSSGTSATASAVVFAYHEVGVRCLEVLVAAGIDVRLVVTHADNPAETIWFGSVAEHAAAHHLRCIAPADGNDDKVLAACRSAEPDFLFSFYYRQMLGPALLAVPRRGAYNLHGSLLPRYRGRAPVNWAVLHGEHETGASLHAMDVKPDHGALVDQCAVPILPDDTARQVFDKVTLAAETVVARSLPLLIDGTAPHRPQDLSRGSYFGGRTAEDGRIGPALEPKRIHDLVRAVAPPDYPGAFFDTAMGRVVIWRTRLDAGSPAPPGPTGRLALLVHDGGLWLRTAGGRPLQVLACTLASEPLDAATFIARFGKGALDAST